MVAVEARIHEEEPAEDRQPEPRLGGEGLFAQPHDPAGDAEDEHRAKQKDTAVGRHREQRRDVRIRQHEHAERAVRVFEDGILEVVVQRKGRTEIHLMIPAEEQRRGESAEGEKERAPPVRPAHGKQRVEPERDDRAAGHVVCDHREASAKTREHGMRGFFAEKIEGREEQDGGEIVIEEQRAERKKRGAKGERKCGQQRGRLRAAGEVAGQPEEEHAAERGEQADGENRGHPGVQIQRPPMIGIEAEGALEVEDREIRG